MGKNCIHCGYELMTDPRFCPNCGEKLHDNRPQSYNPKFEGNSIRYTGIRQSSVKTASKPRKRKKARGLGIFWLLVPLLVVAYWAHRNNPNEEESKVMVNNLLKDQLNNYLSIYMQSEEAGEFGKIGSMLGMSLVPTLVDNFTTTKVEDHYVYTSFSNSITIKDQETTIVSGIIVFGKIIPLHSDLLENDRIKELIKGFQ